MVSIILSNLKSVKRIYHHTYNEFRELDYSQLFQNGVVSFVCYFKKNNKGREKELEKNKYPPLNYVHLLRVYNLFKFKAVWPTLQHLLIKSHGVSVCLGALFPLLHTSAQSTPGLLILPEAGKFEKIN